MNPKTKSRLVVILTVLFIVIIGFMTIVAMRPSDFRVTRSMAMLAPPEAVFAQVNDFHKWEAWSPWAKIDPAMKQTYEGAPEGVGAIYNWEGNMEVGSGRITMIESRPNDFIQLRLEFFKPMKGVNTAEFTFKPEGEQTVVTWTMFGKNNFICKAFQLFMSMDKMIGDQFEKGLSDMKAIVERQAP